MVTRCRGRIGPGDRLHPSTITLMSGPAVGWVHRLHGQKHASHLNKGETQLTEAQLGHGSGGDNVVPSCQPFTRACSPPGRGRPECPPALAGRILKLSQSTQAGLVQAVQGHLGGDQILWGRAGRLRCPRPTGSCLQSPPSLTGRCCPACAAGYAAPLPGWRSCSSPGFFPASAGRTCQLSSGPRGHRS